MNTEARVLATLNKIKEVQSKRKDLGAIEDAVKEVQDNIFTIVTNIETLLYSLNTETEQIVDGMFGYAMQAKDMVTTAQSTYDEYEAEYLKLAQELDALGLSYEGLDVSIRSDFKDAINYANLLANTEL